MTNMLMRFWNSPTGPKTILFWAPTFNWGFILASVLDSKKKPEDISSRLLIILIGYSTMFARFAWMISPRNYLLCSCHTTNVLFQSRLLYKKNKILKERETAHKALAALAPAN